MFANYTNVISSSSLVKFATSHRHEAEAKFSYGESLFYKIIRSHLYNQIRREKRLLFLIHSTLIHSQSKMTILGSCQLFDQYD